MRGLAWLGLAQAVFFCATCQARDLTFKIGSVMKRANDVPQCPGTESMVQGYLVPVERLNRGIGHGVDGLITKVSLMDRSGQEFRIKFDYVNREPSACTNEEHDKEVERLIEEDRIHFLLGNTHFAFSEAKIANEAKKLTYHCCFETDELFKMDYPYIFGIANLADQETHQALTSMALEDSFAKLLIFYTKDFRYATQACENAVSYASSQLRRISTKFEIVKVLDYSSANTSSNPSFYDSVVVEQAVQSGATAVLGCDNSLDGVRIARAFGRIKHKLKAFFLTLSPATPDFAEAVGPEIAEYTLTSSSWHPMMLGQGDSFFGLPEQYAYAYEEATGSPPYFVPALASATVVSLIFAIKSAFEDCEFIDPANLDADRLLFDPNAIRCPNSTVIVPGVGLPTTGYDMLLKSLSAQSMSTFLGNVEFNHFRRNIAHDPVVLQVQNGVPEIVLPLEQASQKLIMPIPNPEKESKIGALKLDTFIVVVVVVIAGTLTLLSALLLVFFVRRQHAHTVESLLTIEPEQLQIINLPVQCGTTWESGKARLRNTLVALEPLREINCTSGETTTQNRSLWMTGKPLVADSNRMRSFGRESEGAFAGLTKSHISADIDLESLQHEDTCTTGGSLNGESLHRTTVHGGSFSNRRPVTAPSMPTIQPVSFRSLPNNTSAVSLPSPASLSLMPTRDRCHSNPLTQRQVLDLVWRSKNLQHPSVVPVVGVMWSLPGMPANIPVLVTECCELGSLTSVLDNKTMELDFLKQLDITKDLADALAYLHAQDKPYLRPALTSKLAGVQLNKLVRAKLRVPLTAFLSAQGNSDASPQNSGCLRSGSQDCPELQDVFQFGRGIVQLHTVCPGVSSSGVVPELTLEGNALTITAYFTLERSRGHGFAVLLRECCSIDPSLRPTFTQIVQRLETLEPEVMQAAQNASKELFPTTVPESPECLSPVRSCTFGSLTQSKSRQRTDSLLYELLPPNVAASLKSGNVPDPEPYPSVSLLFSDVVGYTDLCCKLAPEEVFDMLHRLYTRFDTLAQSFRLFKVETIGDAYMCASNLVHPEPEAYAAQMAAFAFTICAAANQVPVCESNPELGNIHIRVGIHAGPVMGAVVGILNRRFSLFGDTVNVASRMESTSAKDTIQCSASFMELLQQQWPEAASLAAPQGLKPIKGKGPMSTFFLYPPQQIPSMFPATGG